jgi:hypothetical protein
VTRIVNVYKAQPSGYNYGTVETVHIHVDLEMPRGDWPEDYARRDANIITNALYASLPASTIDALLAAMLTRRAAQLRRVLAGPVDQGVQP